VGSKGGYENIPGFRPVAVGDWARFWLSKRKFVNSTAAGSRPYRESSSSKDG
jgi:hypothetical protein